jgi:Fe-S-cluster-containing hydrogenase component 2
MAKRKIISIDENKCNGCGESLPNCPEGAIQVIAGKARLVSDSFCDGLQAHKDKINRIIRQNSLKSVTYARMEVGLRRYYPAGAGGLR